MDDLNIMQMSLDDDSLKIEKKYKSLNGTMNVFDGGLKDHQQYHQLLLELNRPIWEAMVLV